MPATHDCVGGYLDSAVDGHAGTGEGQEARAEGVGSYRRPNSYAYVGVARCTHFLSFEDVNKFHLFFKCLKKFVSVPL